jgi:hypothetical protein
MQTRRDRNPNRYSGATWVAPSCNIPDPHDIVPSYESAGVATDTAFTASAHGQLDCDSICPTFQRHGAISSTTGEVQA